MEFKQSLLISNILDPLTKNNEDLIQMYCRLAEEKRYAAVETRLIKEEVARDSFNQLAQKARWDTTLWLTGDMGRQELSLSSLDATKLEASIAYLIELLDIASDQDCQHIGLASGPLEDSRQKGRQIQNFAQSIDKIADYITQKNYKFDLLVEPLDEFAHKKNTVGKLSSIEAFIDQLNVDFSKFNLCFDTAHSALNEDDLAESVEKMAPYVSRIHFADAVLDKTSKEYGDNHREFDQLGIMNMDYAEQILRFFERYSARDSLFVASEVRTAERVQAWENEEKYYQFVKASIERYSK
jgi:sugar phosphate isomerase/epimerase